MIYFDPLMFINFPIIEIVGVLWINNNAIPGSAEAMNFFRNLGKKIFYVTNNSTKTRSEFALKAQQLGFIAEPVKSFYMFRYFSLLNWPFFICIHIFFYLYTYCN